MSISRLTINVWESEHGFSWNVTINGRLEGGGGSSAIHLAQLDAREFVKKWEAEHR